MNDIDKSLLKTEPEKGLSSEKVTQILEPYHPNIKKEGKNYG